MLRKSQLPAALKHLGASLRLVLCTLLVSLAMLGPGPLVGFGRTAAGETPPVQAEEEETVAFGSEQRTVSRRALDVPLHLTRKGRIGRCNTSHALVCGTFRRGHRLPNGLMAPLRC